MGLTVHITELDVRCGKGNTPPHYFADCQLEAGDSWTSEMIEKQADIYDKVLRVCLESPNCVEVTAWNYEDKYVSSAFEPPQYPFPFDETLQPKLCWQRMIDTLNGFNRTSDANMARLRGEFGF